MLTKAIRQYNFATFMPMMRCYTTPLAACQPVMMTRVPIRIRVNVKPEVSEATLLQEKLSNMPEQPACYFPDAYKAVPNPTWTARKNNISYSSYKLMCVANLITGKHLFDAMNVISQVDKKGGPVVRSVLEAARKNGENKGFCEERMFVKTSIVNKKIHHKKLDIKGRGRQGMIKVPESALIITLEERSPQDFYKLIMQGKTPAGVSHTIRRMLYQNDADLKTVQSMSHLTTSSGRHYRKTQFRRLVSMVKAEYQSKGVVMKDAKIERNLLEKASREFVDLSNEMKEKHLLTSKASRQEIFDKNYKKQ